MARNKEDVEGEEWDSGIELGLCSAIPNRLPGTPAPKIFLSPPLCNAP